jgi:hypothetical protein
MPMLQQIQRNQIFCRTYGLDVMLSFSTLTTSKIFDKILLINSKTPGLNKSWRISTTPNTTKLFFTIFKLIQQSNMVILSCPAKKNQSLQISGY